MKSLLLIALVALSAVSAIRTDETRSTLAATVSAARALDTELLTNRIAHTYKTQYDLASQSELEKEDQKLLKGIKQLDKLLAKAEQQVQEQLQVVSHVKDGKASTHETHRFRADNNKEVKEKNNNKAAPTTATPAANAVGTAAAQAVSSPTATAAAAPAQQAPEPKFVYRYVPPTAKEKEKENAKAKSANSAPTSGVSVPPTPAAASAAPTPAAVVPTPAAAAAAAAPTTSGVTAPVAAAAAAAAAPVVKSAPEVVYKYSYTPPKASDKKVEQQKSSTAAASVPTQTQIQPQAVAAPVVSAPVPAAVAPTTPAVAQAAVAPAQAAQAAPAAPAPAVEKKKEELKKSDKKVAALSFAPLDSLGSVVPEAVRNSGLDAVSASTDKLFTAKAASAVPATAPSKAQEKAGPTAAVAPAPPATTPAEAPGTIPATPTVPNAAPLKNSLGGSMANALSGSIATASLQTQSSSLASQAMATSLGVKNSPPLRRTAHAAVAANSNLAQTTSSDPAAAAAPSAPKGTTAYPGLHLVDDPLKAELAGHGISVLKSNHLASDASKGLTVFSPNGAADGAYTSCSCGLLPTGVCPCAGAEKPNPQPGDADPSKATPPKPAFILRTGKYDKNASPCLTLNQNCSKIDFGKEHDLPANQQRAHVRRANPVSDLPPRLIVPEKLIVPVTDNASQAVAESSSNHNEHSDDGHHSYHANEHSGEHGGSDSGAGDIPIKADPPIPLYPYDKDEMMVLNNIASIAN